MTEIIRPMERRRGDRRKIDCGPPQGCQERRVNIERRVFDFPFEVASQAVRPANSLGR